MNGFFLLFSTGVNPTRTNDTAEWYCRMILWCDSGLIQKKGKREQVLRDWRAKLGSKTSLTPCSSNLYPFFTVMSGVLSYYWSERVALRDNTPPNPVKLPWFTVQGKRWTHTQSVFTKVWVGRLTESTGQLALGLRRCVRRCVRGNVEEMTQWGKWGVSAVSARCLLNISPVIGFDGTLRFVKSNTWLLKPLRDVYEP